MYVVSACTLRQALDGRLPALRTTVAYARATGADEATARRLWTAASGPVPSSSRTYTRARDWPTAIRATPSGACPSRQSSR